MVTAYGNSKGSDSKTQNKTKKEKKKMEKLTFHWFSGLTGNNWQ